MDYHNKFKLRFCVYYVTINNSLITTTMLLKALSEPSLQTYFSYNIQERLEIGQFKTNIIYIHFRYFFRDNSSKIRH